MRHLKKKKTLDRKAGPRKALLRNLAVQLILYEKINTTEAKAKVLRPYVERLITRGRENTLAARRILLSRMHAQNAVQKLIEDVSPRYKERAGGYTRITKLVQRKGDGAKMARIELV